MILEDFGLTIYILLLCLVLLLPGIYQGLGYYGEENKKKVLKAIFLMIFLICALKSSEVGRDISAYKLGYEMTQNVAFSNFTYIYYETGYKLFMKVCVSLGCPFQLFMALVYAIITIPIYTFIKKFSDDTWLSALIYICYMYFEFNMTGIRQALASSICLIAFTVLLENGKWKFLKYIALVTLAVSFHSAAFIAYFAIIALLIPSIRAYSLLLFAGSGAMLFMRGPVLSFIKAWASKDSMNASAAIYIGGNFIFIAFIGILFLFSVIRRQRNICCIHASDSNNAELMYFEESVNRDALLTKIFLMSIPFLLLFGADNSVRSSMLLSQVLMVLLPNSLDCFSVSSQKMVRIALVVFLIVFFFTNTLVPNNFDIVPYQFFWQ